MSNYLKGELNLIQTIKIIMMLTGLAFFILIGIKALNTMNRINEIANIYETRVNLIK